MVLFFSGTGNSRYTARKIAAVTGDGLLSLNIRIKAGDTSPVESGRNVVIVAPTYAWRLPQIVEKWLLETQLTGAENVWFVMTCGSEIGNAHRYNKEICDKKHLNYMGTIAVVMPENYIAMFRAPDKEKAAKIIDKAEETIVRAAETIRFGQPFTEKGINPANRFKSSKVNSVFYRFFIKASAFKTEDKCTGCGACVRNCPLNNISLSEKRPVWGTDCTHCMACICLCPVEAIEYGRSSRGKHRYHLD